MGASRLGGQGQLSTGRPRAASGPPDPGTGGKGRAQATDLLGTPPHCACMHTHGHTSIPACTHVCTPTCLHTCAHTSIPIGTHACTPSHTRAPASLHTPVCRPTCPHTCAHQHRYMHPCVHTMPTHVCTPASLQAYTRAHEHRRPPRPPCTRKRPRPPCVMQTSSFACQGHAAGLRLPACPARDRKQLAGAGAGARASPRIPAPSGPAPWRCPARCAWRG